MSLQVRKLAHYQQVRVEDGVPVCPHCDDPMVPGPEPGTWQCWLVAAAMALLGEERRS
jgi:hypothetical protein